MLIYYIFLDFPYIIKITVKITDHDITVISQPVYFPEETIYISILKNSKSKFLKNVFKYTSRRKYDIYHIIFLNKL